MVDAPHIRLMPALQRARRLSNERREVPPIESVSVLRFDPHMRGLVMPQKAISLPRLKFLEKGEA